MNKLFTQIWRFVLVGLLNTGIDFAVLNLLMWIFNIQKGGWIIPITGLAFLTAVTNSYFWNRFWTFKKQDDTASNLASQETSQQIPKFLAISLGGLIINTGVIYLITTFIPPLIIKDATLWANFAKAVATGLSLIWNFAGYKFVVFKR